MFKLGRVQLTQLFTFFFPKKQNMVLQLAARSSTFNLRRANVTLNKSFHVSVISRQQQQQQKKPLFGKFSMPLFL